MGAVAAALVLGFSLWTAGVGSALAINYWAQWLLAAGLLLLGFTFGARCWMWWRRIIWVYGLVISVYQAVALSIGMQVPTAGSDAPDFYSARLDFGFTGTGHGHRTCRSPRGHSIEACCPKRSGRVAGIQRGDRPTPQCMGVDLSRRLGVRFRQGCCGTLDHFEVVVDTSHGWGGPLP